MAKALKILSVGSTRKYNKVSSFRKEQVESLREMSIQADYFNICGGGVANYQKSFGSLKSRLKIENYDLIHCHYGLSGMISVLQRKVPVVVTFHGSDIWQYKVRFISQVTSYLSTWNIFISQRLKIHAKGFRKNRCSIIPCGVDLITFYPMDKEKALKKMSFDPLEKYVLFSSSFSNRAKNYTLARSVIQHFEKVKLIELNNYTQN